jgi:hypothetical protein
MGSESLAETIGQPSLVSRELLRAHHETYRDFWRWSDAVVTHAKIHNSLHTVFGWHHRTSADTNPRFLRNFPMQANGAEMMRLACCLATERGVGVCAPVHDAVMICAPIERLEHEIAEMRAAMARASRVILGGFELRTDVHRVLYPHRYHDGRGTVMWDRVMKLIGATKAEKEVA